MNQLRNRKESVPKGIILVNKTMKLEITRDEETNSFSLICEEGKLIMEDWCLEKCNKECRIKDDLKSKEFKKFFEKKCICENEGCQNRLSKSMLLLFWELEKTYLLPNSYKIVCCDCNQK